MITPEVSVVVATYRRAQLLPRLFEALAAQTLGTDRFELVVVDDASPDRTAAVLAGLAHAAPMPTSVLHAAANGGPAAARNRGWRAARAPVVAFTDDDCTPAAGWLAAGLAALGDDERIVAGRTEPDPAQLDKLGPFARTIRVADTALMQACNVFYRRADLERAGGFEERLRTGEDTDLGLRVAAGGSPAVFAPDALVYHDVRPSRWRSSLREAWSWSDLPLVVKRHPQLRRSHAHRRVFWKRSHPPTLLALAGLAIAVRHRAGLALLLPWAGYRLAGEPLSERRAERLLTLPGAFAVDVVEVLTMARGSARHRSVLL